MRGLQYHQANIDFTQSPAGRVCLKSTAETCSDCSDKIVTYTYAAEGHALLKALTKRTVYFYKTRNVFV